MWTWNKTVLQFFFYLTVFLSIITDHLNVHKLITHKLNIKEDSNAGAL